MKRASNKLVLIMVIAVASSIILLGAVAKAADPFPTKPITMIDPWPPGGGVDIIGRILASVATEHLGQPLVMKYISGAAGVRGAEEGSLATPDGYTITLIGFGAIVTQTVSMPEKATFGKDDFVFIAQASTSPCVLVANPKAPFKTIKELIAYVKKNPGKIVYSSSGRFGFVHSAVGRLIKAAGIEGTMIHLPTKGGAAAAKELLGGHTMLSGGTVSLLEPHIRAGSVVPLAICDTKRNPLIPDVPTIKEASGFDISPTTLWVAPAVPKGTPADRVEFLRKGFKKILEDKSVIKLAARTGDQISYLSGPDMQKKWEQEFSEAGALSSILLEKK